MTGPFAAPLSNASVTDLFGNFTQMSFNISLDNPDNATESIPDSFSYALLGQPVINSSHYYDVNFTLNDIGEVSSYNILFASNGTATSITSSGLLGNSTGSLAASLGSAFMQPFLLEIEQSAIVKAIPGTPGLTVINETTLSLGATPVKVTFYGFGNLPISFCSGGSIANITVGLGTPPGTNVPMILYAGETFDSPSISFQFSQVVTSLTVAGH